MPRRGRVVIAKAIVTVTTAAVSTAIAIALAVPASAMIATHRGYHVILSNHETWRIVIGTWLTVVVLAVFGFGIGCALKQPVAGIVVALVWATLGEGLVGSIFHSTERWLPINALHNAYDNFSDPSRLQWYRGLLYCGGVGVAMAIIGAIRIAKTDA